jgi:hypothetical protein
MSGRERVIAGFLLVVAVAGAAVIPRLLSAPPAGRLSIALGPQPSRSVVQAPAIRRAPQRPTAPRVQPPAAPVAAPAAPVVVRPAANPSAVHTKHVSPPPSATTGSLTPPPPPTPPTTTPIPPPPPPASLLSTRPGHGYGDKNHIHTGPAGPPAQASPAVQPGQRSHGRDLEGSGHGRPLSQTPSNAVGPRDRGLGHLASAPPAAAPAADEAGQQAWPQAGGPGSQGGPPAPVAPSPGNQGQGQGKGHG